MTSELSKYLNEELGVFLNVNNKNQVSMLLVFHQILMLSKFLKISYVLLEVTDICSVF